MLAGLKGMETGMSGKTASAGTGGDAALHERRASYVPVGPSETFIVPLLRDWIETQLHAFSRPDGRMLDVGCGEQPFRELVNTLNMTYESLDIEQNASRTVQIIASLNHPIRVSYPGIPRYDLVLCSEVLEHVADWGAAFANLAELMQPDGTLLVTCPHVYPPHEEPADFWRPTPNALRRFAVENGLTVIAITSAGGGWGTLGTVVAGAFATPTTHGLSDRVLSRMTNHFLSAMLRLSRSRHFRDRVHVTGDIPLVTLGIFRKP